MVKLTPEMIQNANTYLPILEKANLAEAIARRAVISVSFSYKTSETAEPVPMPSGAQEAPFLTSMCLMGVLASKYLKQGGDWDDDIQMPANLYDEWAGSHVMNQLERMKADKSIAGRVYDLLADYKEFRWMVRQMVETKVAQGMDVVSRLHQMLSASALDVSPKQLEEALEQLEKMQRKMPEESREKPAGKGGKG